MRSSPMLIKTTFTIVLWWALVAYWYGATLHNLENNDLQRELDQINRTYDLNVDVVYLEAWDRCAMMSAFSDCVRDELDDWVDLVFVINDERRRMETSIRDSILDVLPKNKALDREASAVSSLQSNNISWAIQSYLNSMKLFIESQCGSYWTEPCTIRWLQLDITEFLDQAAEDRARQRLLYTQWILWLVVLGLILLWGTHRIRTLNRNKKNKQLLQQLKDHSTFLRMSIRNDTTLFEQDKKNLLIQLTWFDKQIEQLLSSTPKYIQLHLQNNQYAQKLSTITQLYQQKLSIVHNIPELQKRLHEIKQLNI